MRRLASEKAFRLERLFLHGIIPLNSHSKLLAIIIKPRNGGIYGAMFMSFHFNTAPPYTNNAMEFPGPNTTTMTDNETSIFLTNSSMSTENATFATFDEDYSDYNMWGPKRDPLYVVIPITCIYMAIFVTGVVGNISTCVVIARNRSMHTATNYYLFSLAVSDFLLLIAGVPQEMYSIWSKYPYVFGELFCVMRGMAAEAAANATVLTITAFTVERYVAICHPFLSHTMSKLSRAVRLIGVVWLCSIAMAVPQALQFGVVTVEGVEQCEVTRIIIEHSFELSTFVFFVGPMTLITVLYVLIGLKLRSASLMPRASGATLQRRTMQSSSLRQQTSQGTKRVLKMLGRFFVVCWLSDNNIFVTTHLVLRITIYTRRTRDIY